MFFRKSCSEMIQFCFENDTKSGPCPFPGNKKIIALETQSFRKKGNYGLKGCWFEDEFSFLDFVET